VTGELTQHSKVRTVPRCRIRVGSVRQVTTNHVFVDLYAEGVRGLLGDPHAAEARIAPLHIGDDRDEFHRSTNASSNLTSVAGSGTITDEQLLLAQQRLGGDSSHAPWTQKLRTGGRPGR
jgi:hypothetical protein